MKGVGELVSNLNNVFSDDKDDSILINGKKIKIDSENLHRVKPVKTKSKIAFVDGGNAVLFASSNFCLQFIRVYYCIFQENKKFSEGKREFFCLTKAASEAGELKYKSEFFGDKVLDPLEFNAFDPTLKKGSNQCEIAEIGGIVRRFAELKLAKEVSEELSKEDVVVLDGSLKPAVVGEKKYLDDIKGIVLCSLSKTNSLVTEKGNSASAILLQHDFNYFILDDHTLLVKLNKNSNHVFKLEVNDKEQIDSVLSLLISNSNDAVFPGYPYGLILADRFARVSNKEKEYLQTFLQSKTKNGLRNCLSSSNAHSILDSI